MKTRGKSIVFASLLLLSATAHAHHILGLPHWEYKKNYPQSPTMEIEAEAGDQHVIFTTYPGSPRPGDTVVITLYAKSKTTGKAYQKDITFSIEKSAGFKGRKLIRPPQKRQVSQNQYKMNHTFAEAGQYFVNVDLDIGDRIEHISFPLVVGDQGPNYYFIGVVLLVVVGGIAAVRTIKRRQAATKAHSTRSAGATAP